jgi:hypothetical protein
MAMGFAQGAIQWLTTDALNATKVVTDLGFSPKAIRFYWMGHQSATDSFTQAVSERRGIGFCSNATTRRAVGTFSADNSASSDCGSVAANDCVCITVDGAGTVDGKLDISSIDVNGFTLIVDDVTPANLTIFFEAWGLDDIQQVTIGDIAEPAATGTQVYTANGFNARGDTQCVMFAGVQSTAALNTGQVNDSGLCVGASTGTATAQNIVVVGNSDDGSDPMDTDGYARASECLAMIVVAGGNPNARAVLSAFGTDTFTLNWTNRGTTNRRFIYMAIKGGGWRVGSYTIRQDAGRTAAITGLPFILKGISFMGAMKTQAAAGTATVQDRIGLGSASGLLARKAMGVLDENNTASSEIDLAISYDSISSYPSATGTEQARQDLSVFGYNNFTAIVEIDEGGPENEWMGYLAFGSTKLPMQGTIGHPFVI